MGMWVSIGIPRAEWAILAVMAMESMWSVAFAAEEVSSVSHALPVVAASKTSLIFLTIGTPSAKWVSLGAGQMESMSSVVSAAISRIQVSRALRERCTGEKHSALSIMSPRRIIIGILLATQACMDAMLMASTCSAVSVAMAASPTSLAQDRMCASSKICRMCLIIGT